MLTKSDLQSCLQCPRKLWLEHHRPDLAGNNDSQSRRRAMDGNIVGDRARSQVRKPFVWPPSGANKNEAADEAKRLLAASPGEAAIEFPMLHANLYARADALIPDLGGYILRETKASTFPLKKDGTTPAEPDEHHLVDVAIQAWVMNGAGIEFSRAELNLLNSKWRYPGNNDYEGLFRQLDVTAKISQWIDDVPTWLQTAEAVLQGEMPQATTGRQCNDPYDCQFHDYCVPLDPAGPEHPIELLPDKTGKDLARTLKESRGYTSITDPAPAELVGKQAELYRRIQQAHKTGQAVHARGAREILAALPYPRYFFDFEGIDLPVPRWTGVRPYEQIPFQWSCHIETVRGEFHHAEFLDLSGDDPSVPCIERMIETIDPDGVGPIFVYYATYERGRLEDLAIRHPEFANSVQRIIDLLFDLHPLVKNHFYHPAMRGSFSIKKVLPVIAPDLDYEGLDEVQDGTAAQVAYIDAALDETVTPARKRELAEKLSIYCKQDTWAMVEVAYFLSGDARPARSAGL